MKLPGLLHPTTSKSHSKSEALTPSTPKWRVAPSVATTTRRISPKGWACWQKASKAVRRVGERNSGGMLTSAVVWLLLLAGAVVAVSCLDLGFIIFRPGDGKGSVEDVLDNVLLASSLPFSVETSPTFDLPVCIKSRGNSRNANATISCSTSGSSDSKVIWVLFGREIDTLTMVTLNRLL